VLIELLRDAAVGTPERPLLLSPHGTTTYAACVERSEAFARGLQARAIRRFAIVVSDPASVIAHLAASTAIGAEACIYPARLDAAEVAAQAASFDHDVIVTDRTGTADLGWLAIADLPTDEGELPPAPEAAPALILTTGTTGKPKGARHDWRRLVAGVRRPDPAPVRWLLAYNLNQFAGLQILLHVLVSHSTLVVPESNQPRLALEAIREFEVTHASATPTFWRFIVALLDADTGPPLPLRQITLGGEAVPGPLLDDLKRRFPDANVSQIYASTEFGSSGSVGGERNGLPVAILQRDNTADVQFRVVEGQLEARSNVGMLGYYGDDDTTKGWRPTGDLVEISGDRLLFVGRTSEIINVGGVKVHPLPIEERVLGVDGVDIAHVYGRKNAMTGQIVAVDVVARADVDVDVLRDAVRDACASLPPAAQPRRIRFVDELDVRESKVARGAQPDERPAPR
jgi:acyl-coenzyme A synthetase/AMP-(fatty) acid ligase